MLTLLVLQPAFDHFPFIFPKSVRRYREERDQTPITGYLLTNAALISIMTFEGLQWIFTHRGGLNNLLVAQFCAAFAVLSQLAFFVFSLENWLDPERRKEGFSSRVNNANKN